MMRAFDDNIRIKAINMYTRKNQQNHLANSIKEFKKNTRKAKGDLVNSTITLNTS